MIKIILFFLFITLPSTRLALKFGIKVQKTTEFFFLKWLTFSAVFDQGFVPSGTNPTTRVWYVFANYFNRLLQKKLNITVRYKESTALSYKDFLLDPDLVFVLGDSIEFSPQMELSDMCSHSFVSYVKLDLAQMKDNSFILYAEAFCGQGSLAEGTEADKIRFTNMHIVSAPRENKSHQIQLAWGSFLRGIKASSWNRSI